MKMIEQSIREEETSNRRQGTETQRRDVTRLHNY